MSLRGSVSDKSKAPLTSVATESVIQPSAASATLAAVAQSLQNVPQPSPRSRAAAVLAKSRSNTSVNETLLSTSNTATPLNTHLATAEEVDALRQRGAMRVLEEVAIEQGEERKLLYTDVEIHAPTVNGGQVGPAKPNILLLS